MQWVPPEDEKQPEQEPVAWMREDEDCSDCIVFVWEQTEEHTIPLYTAPPQRTWVGLTDAEIKSEAKYFCHGWYSQNPERLVLLVKTIQAKLREKNGE